MSKGKEHDKHSHDKDKKEKDRKPPERFNFELVAAALLSVENDWQRINNELDVRGIGKKDEFTSVVRENVLSGYEYLDGLLATGLEPFSLDSISEMLSLNNRIHYGTDQQLRREYSGALHASSEQFYHRIDPIIDWYKKHEAAGDHPLKIAAEIYVAILGQPQLFIEGNHRTGNLIANWINMYYGKPPFVLSAENALSYFAPAAEIKYFTNKSTWRGQFQLPKYRKSFRAFWENHLEAKYLLKKHR